MDKNNQFVKMPIMTASGTVFGYEVLLREFNGISLDTFNRYPELYTEFCFEILSVISSLDNYHKIRQKGESLFINLTLDQLLSDGALTFLNQFYRSDSKVDDVIIEITENEMLYQNTAMLQERILLFRALGYQFAIDDFGVEHSNFQRVFDIRPDFIKLDSKMVITYSEQEQLNPAFKHLIDFCHQINTQVIAEGIESEKTYKRLTLDKVDYFQGYLFGQPQRLDL
ncbi:EAL domain-containing protein [Shewanella woodyi]|uniref:Diguanylate phosphodiesterase n=1 Tax=Shewanella woodyi (strain ATCC 51908 / MS32) TaxID=392500 RepID=B1KF87_SHEWM|nr:EAL domain-containing protein [Shewanella woodyi]ACA86628.1 diguanylate phosphodiesterase [Shewanella woodyi ATCC 51908]